jgi:dephospho-CoA kinase
MRIIGLCGRSGSGKGSFCKIAAKNGIKVIDCDVVYKELVSKPSECLFEIAKHFGSDAIKDQSLNREYLAEIVFSDKSKLILLNEITHKYIRAEVNKILADANDDDIIILDAPTLFESGIDEICDTVIGILASDTACAERITLRDGISTEKALSRLSNQLTNDFIIEHSDIVVYNESSLTELEKASESVIASLRR